MDKKEIKKDPKRVIEEVKEEIGIAKPTRFESRYNKSFSAEKETNIYSDPTNREEAIATVAVGENVRCQGYYIPFECVPWLLVNYKGNDGYINSAEIA